MYSFRRFEKRCQLFTISNYAISSVCLPKSHKEELFVWKMGPIIFLSKYKCSHHDNSCSVFRRGGRDPPRSAMTCCALLVKPERVVLSEKIVSTKPGRSGIQLEQKSIKRTQKVL